MHRKALTAVLAVAAIAALAIAPSAASAWAPASSATVHPGVQVFTAGAQCTSNFVFQDGSNTYLGQAAHCSGTGSSTDTDGCTSGFSPDRHTGGRHGREPSGDARLQLVAHHAVEGGGGRRHLRVQRPRPDQARPGRRGERQSVGSGIRRPDGPRQLGQHRLHCLHLRQFGAPRRITALSPKQGIVVQNTPSGWSHDVYTVSPGIPGDSGSGFMDASGGAIGILSTVQLAPPRRCQRRRRSPQGARLHARQRAGVRGRQPGARHRAVQRERGSRGPEGRRGQPLAHSTKDAIGKAGPRGSAFPI